MLEVDADRRDELATVEKRAGCDLDALDPSLKLKMAMLNAKRERQEAAR